MCSIANLEIFCYPVHCFVDLDAEFVDSRRSGIRHGLLCQWGCQLWCKIVIRVLSDNTSVCRTGLLGVSEEAAVQGTEGR